MWVISCCALRNQTKSKTNFCKGESRAINLLACLQLCCQNVTALGSPARKIISGLLVALLRLETLHSATHKLLAVRNNTLAHIEISGTTGCLASRFSLSHTNSGSAFSPRPRNPSAAPSPKLFGSFLRCAGGPWRIPYQLQNNTDDRTDGNKTLSRAHGRDGRADIVAQRRLTIQYMKYAHAFYYLRNEILGWMYTGRRACHMKKDEKLEGRSIHTTCALAPRERFYLCVYVCYNILCAHKAEATEPLSFHSLAHSKPRRSRWKSYPWQRETRFLIDESRFHGAMKKREMYLMDDH